MVRQNRGSLPKKRTAKSIPSTSLLTQSNIFETLDTVDPGDDVQRRFRYQHAYGVILLFAALTGRQPYTALWCEHYEDLLAERNDGLFDAYQVKTAQDGLVHMSGELLKDSIKRFVEIDQRFPNTVNRFFFVSSARYEKSNAQNKVGRSPEKFLEAVKAASAPGDLKPPFHTTFERLRLHCQCEPLSLMLVLKKLGLICGPVLDSFETEIAHNHLPTLPECQDLPTMALNQLLDDLIAKMGKASSFTTNDPARHLRILNQNDRDNPLLQAKRITPESIRSYIQENRSRLLDLVKNTPLSKRQQFEASQMAHYFFQCRSMQNKQSLEQVFHYLPEDIIQKIDASLLAEQGDKTIDFAAIARIVDICSSGFDGLEKLVYAIYQVERASQSWQTLDTYLRAYSGKLVTYTRRQELHEILQSVEWLPPFLGKLYRESIPESWEALRNLQITDRLSAIVEDLANIPLQNHETFPLLEFVQRLADLASERFELSLHDALRGWLGERFSELNLTEKQQAALREKARKKWRPAAFYLQLMLEAVSDEAFHVQCALVDDENHEVENAGIELPDGLYSLQDISRPLEQLLERCENCLQGEMQHLVIEFFLPLEWLSYPVDQVTLRDSNRSQSISLYHQVIVRSLERTRKHSRRYIWQNKWKRIQELQNLNEHENVTWVYRAEHHKGSENLFATLQGNAVACFALAFVPSGLSQDDDILFAILDAGVPVVLWPRKQTNYPKELHELLTELISQHPLSQLPAFVHQQRREAINEQQQQHQGYHLTLLWDDPTRLSPSERRSRQLTMPLKRRGA